MSKRQIQTEDEAKKIIFNFVKNAKPMDICRIGQALREHSEDRIKELEADYVRHKQFDRESESIKTMDWISYYGRQCVLAEAITFLGMKADAEQTVDALFKAGWFKERKVKK